jgi:hypothetical protein
MREDHKGQALSREGHQGVGAVDLGRRRVLEGVSLAAMSAAIGAAIPFGRFMPEGYMPVALAQEAKLDIPGK